jgi:two-component system, sensor histidine kinase and response regulator
MSKYLTFICLLIFSSNSPVFSQTVKDSLWALLVQSPKDTTKIKILNQLHSYYQYQATNSRNLDSAEHYTDEAYQLALKMDTENLDTWTAIRNKAVFTFQEKKDLVNAVKLYLKANAIVENLHDTLNIGNGFIAIGNIYTYQHLHDKALNYYLKSLYLFEKKQSKPYISLSSNVLGYTYRALSKMDSAEYYYKKAINLSLETPTKFRLQSYLYNIIDLYQSQNKTEQAQYYLNLAYQNKDIPSEQLTFIAKQLNIGKYYQTQKQYKEAVRYLMEAVEMEQKNKALAEDELVVEAYRSLSLCYREMEDYKNAFYFLEKQKTFGDSLNKIIYSRDTAMAIVELQAAFNVERAETALKGQRNYNIGLIILTLLIVGIALLIYRNNRLKDVKNRQLQAQGQLLEAQKKELSAINATKDKLLGLIAHDIRAPLSSLTTLLTLWDTKTISGEKFDEISGKVRSSLHYLRISLDNLLVWSSSQLKGIKAKPETVSIAEIIENEISLLTDTAENKSIQIQFSPCEPPCFALTDSVQLSIVVRNILSNAIKFTRKGGNVCIHVQEAADFYTVTTTDNGIGIPEELVKHLFSNEIDKIRRGTANEKGTGLGLNVAKEFIEANGGTIQVNSAEGKGTEIRFTVRKNTEGGI